VEPRLRVRNSERLLAALASLACLGVLITAAAITPEREGLGTHLQLGLEPCGFLSAFGKPCPTCGMTTAFAQVVRLDLRSAFAAQPFGLLLAIAAAMGFWVALASAVGGYSIAGLGRVFTRPKVWGPLVALMLAAWIFKWLTYVR
jgi:Protein of unknown function (DUF2752)